jgi:Leucine-rich repeat (LRR) protein
LGFRDINDEQLREMVDSGQIPPNITSLSLRNNQITDISPLSGLTELRALDFMGNQITDISPLANLPYLGTGLNGLYLNSNQITDISPLANFSNLRWLTLGGNPITDLTPLEKLIYLEVELLGFRSYTTSLVTEEQIQHLEQTIYRNRASMNRAVLTFGHVLGITPYTVNDAIAILRYSVGLPTVLNDCDCCDNDDGRCDVAWMAALIVSEHEPGVADAIQVLRHSVGLSSVLDERGG